MKPIASNKLTYFFKIYAVVYYKLGLLRNFRASLIEIHRIPVQTIRA